jgi:hypothetical protein
MADSDPRHHKARAARVGEHNKLLLPIDQTERHGRRPEQSMQLESVMARQTESVMARQLLRCGPPEQQHVAQQLGPLLRLVAKPELQRL